MDIRKIKKLIELIEESDIEEIEINEGEESIRISRRSSQPAIISQMAPSFPAMAPLPTAPGGAEPATAATPTGQTIKSPMVGTFYRCPSPESAPFVEVGKPIKTGDTICVVEAMKMMNHIESDINGVIEAILVEDGEAVEFDQPLFIVAN